MTRDVVIGIEIHCELKTNTKMFSGAPVMFAESPNTCVNEIDLGHPGTLPSLNKQAVKLSIMACFICDCTIDRLIRFDRKNYTYSDLPKGYQITQQFYPLGKDGKITIETANGKKDIGIERIHMEEDTAKQFHDEDVTRIDYNRAGTPLIEIVSKPDITSGEEAKAYVEALRNMLLYANISDVKMEEGSLRCDVNISLKDKDSDVLGTKVEIKNLNSLANIQRAIDAEVKRQSELLDHGKVVTQQTRRYDEITRNTIAMRDKEKAMDYRYFPEPNIFPTYITDAFYQEAIASIPLMPMYKKQQLIDDFGLSEQDVVVLINNKQLLDYFDEIMKESEHAKLVCNWLISEVLAIDFKHETYNQLIPVPSFVRFIDLIAQKKINSKQAKEVFVHLLKHKEPDDVIKSLNMTVVDDDSQLLKWVQEVISEHPQSVIDFKNGKDRAVGFLVGQVMKRSKGKANPAKTSEIVREQLIKM
jgi:aspartyl-tRNA(Asn)/glutamyl-tRNA(Gln) amidotransferase subunit B